MQRNQVIQMIRQKKTLPIKKSKATGMTPALTPEVNLGTYSNDLILIDIGNSLKSSLAGTIRLTRHKN